jgi:hypothetical protein
MSFLFSSDKGIHPETPDASHQRPNAHAAGIRPGCPRLLGVIVDSCLGLMICAPLIRRERQDFVLFGWIIASDDSTRGFGCTEIDCFVRNTRRDEEEIAWLANHFVL